MMTRAIIFVSGLSSDCTENDLKLFFRGYGIRAIIMGTGFAFVKLDSNDVHAVVNDLNGKELLRNRVVVEFDIHDERCDPYSVLRHGSGMKKYGLPIRTDYRLIVENLSSLVRWQDLRDFMSKSADVGYAAVQSRNEGFVEFTSYEGMKRAYAQLNGTSFRGTSIRLVEDGSHFRQRCRSRFRSRKHSRSRRDHCPSRSRSHSRRLNRRIEMRSHSTNRAHNRKHSISCNRNESQGRHESVRRGCSRSASRNRNRGQSRRTLSRSISKDRSRSESLTRSQSRRLSQNIKSKFHGRSSTRSRSSSTNEDRNQGSCGMKNDCPRNKNSCNKNKSRSKSHSKSRAPGLISKSSMLRSGDKEIRSFSRSRSRSNSNSRSRSLSRTQSRSR